MSAAQPAHVPTSVVHDPGASLPLPSLELTVLMPCLDEAETVGTCVEKAVAFLAEHSIDGEVLVADNGSTDDSQQRAERAGARVVCITERGYGNALLGGIVAARGRYVIMGDADDSYDFTALMPFLERLRTGADLVMGNRFQGGIAPGAMPALHRYIGNPVLSFVGRLFFQNKIGDFHCGLRGMRRNSILALGLQASGMEFASEMVVKATLAGRQVEEVPTTLSPDGRSRPPHLRSWRDGWRHLTISVALQPALALPDPRGRSIRSRAGHSCCCCTDPARGRNNDSGSKPPRRGVIYDRHGVSVGPIRFLHTDLCE